MNILELINVSKHFPIKHGLIKRTVALVQAVRNVSLSIEAGESFGVVGESGSGKTTLARTILQLIPPTSGQIIFDQQELTGLDPKAMNRLRRQIQMIFQDPHSSLNPRKTVLKCVGEPLAIHEGMGGRAMARKVEELMDLVGLKPEHMHRFPHELSGGQKQRVGIARALALQPKMLLLDEPTSALDVSVQALILNLLEELQDRFDLTYMFISHNLAVIRYVCDRIAVMYLGEVVEEGPVDVIFEEPVHPYTKLLLSAVPAPEPREGGEEVLLEGDIPSPIDIPSGCSFHNRCPEKVSEICERLIPEEVMVSPHHRARCHLCRSD